MEIDISKVVDLQKSFFNKVRYFSVETRIEFLRMLRDEITDSVEEINKALQTDLGKHELESYMTEIGVVLDEISFFIRNLKKWSKTKKVKTPIAHFSSKSYIIPEPYGVVLIMSPWNYPFQLTIEPLIGAIAAGNCIILKPSAYTPNTSKIVKKILNKIFPLEHVCVIEGGRKENKQLLDEKFDYIFFTGSVEVGKIVMNSASKYLTPISLELGGKSPVIVHSSANIPLAAKRVAWGKCLNSGQTCVAPDYVLIEKKVKNEFIECYKKSIAEFYPQKDFSSMSKIVNEKHFNRLVNLIDFKKVIYGGNFDEEKRFVEPTLMDNVSWKDNVMMEEIFGPVLPIIEFEQIDNVIQKIKERPKPLALYLFATDKKIEDKIMSSISFGGGCINDTMIHVANSYLPFGGVGESGMGTYHGKNSFDTFSHYKSVIKKHNFIDLKVRYMPYTKKKLDLIKKLL